MRFCPHVFSTKETCGKNLILFFFLLNFVLDKFLDIEKFQKCFKKIFGPQIFSIFSKQALSARFIGRAILNPTVSLLPYLLKLQFLSFLVGNPLYSQNYETGQLGHQPMIFVPSLESPDSYMWATFLSYIKIQYYIIIVSKYPSLVISQSHSI